MPHLAGNISAVDRPPPAGSEIAAGPGSNSAIRSHCPGHQNPWEFCQAFAARFPNGPLQ